MAAHANDTLMRDIDDLENARKSRKRTRPAEDDDDLPTSSPPPSFSIDHNADLTATWPGQKTPPTRLTGGTFAEAFAYITYAFAKYYHTARTEIIRVPNMDGSKRLAMAGATSRGRTTLEGMPGYYPCSDGSISADESSHSDDGQAPSGSQTDEKARDSLGEGNILTPPSSRPQSQQDKRPDLVANDSDLSKSHTLRERGDAWDRQMEDAGVAAEMHHSALGAIAANLRKAINTRRSSSSESDVSLESFEPDHQCPQLPGFTPCLSYQLKANYSIADSQNANTVNGSFKEKEHKTDQSPLVKEAYAAAKVEQLEADERKAERNANDGNRLYAEVQRRKRIAIREQAQIRQENEARQKNEARRKEEARKEAEARQKEEARKEAEARQKDEARKDAEARQKNVARKKNEARKIEAARQKEKTIPHKEAPLEEARLNQQPQLPQVPRAPTEVVDPAFEAFIEAQAAEDEKLRDQLIRPLDTHWAHRVDKAMSTKEHETVLTTSTDNVPLTRNVFGQLLPQKDANGKCIEKTTLINGKVAPPGWLGDEVVNAFLSATVASKNGYPMYRKSMKEVPPFAAYNSGWSHTYKDKGIEGLENWSKRKGIKKERLLQAERIFFPVNTTAHWTLLIISPRARTIEFVDSSLGKKQPWFDFARSWLKMELGDKYIAEEWEDLPSMSEKQQNFDDCGVFTCMNALASAKDRPFSDVTATKDMLDARRMIAAVLLNGGMHGDWQL